MKRIYVIALTLVLVTACSDQDSSKTIKETNTSPKVETSNKVQIKDIPVTVMANPQCCMIADIKKATQYPEKILMEIEFQNNLPADQEQKTLYFGYNDTEMQLHLLTDKGVFHAILEDKEILEFKQKKKYEFIFYDAQGKPLALSVQNAFEENVKTDDKMKFSHPGTHFYLEDIADEEVMKRIGRTMFNRLYEAELSANEDEARKILDYVFGEQHDVFHEVRDYIHNNVMYGKYDTFNIEFSDEVMEYNYMGGRIQYEAQVKITKYDHEGNPESPISFGIFSFIKVSNTTGDYFYESLEYDFLSGTDAF